MGITQTNHAWKKTGQNVKSKKRSPRKPLVDGPPQRLRVAAVTAALKMPIVEQSLSLFSLNDINQHLTGICGISPPQKHVTRESVQ